MFFLPVSVKVSQSYLTLCDPMDCSLPGSSIHGDSSDKNTGVFAMLSCRVSSKPRDWTQIPRITGRFFTIWASREALILGNVILLCCFPCLLGVRWYLMVIFTCISLITDEAEHCFVYWSWMFPILWKVCQYCSSFYCGYSLFYLDTPTLEMLSLHQEEGCKVYKTTQQIGRRA